jgi:hypothetical protein
MLITNKTADNFGDNDLKHSNDPFAGNVCLDPCASDDPLSTCLYKKEIVAKGMSEGLLSD